MKQEQQPSSRCLHPSCSALWLHLGNDVWVIRQSLMPGMVKRHRDRWAVVLLTLNGRWSMGMQGMSRRTVYRKTLDAAKSVLERHWQNAGDERQPPRPVRPIGGQP